MELPIKLLIVTTSSVTLKAFLLPFAIFFRAKGWQVDAMASGISNCENCIDAFNHTYDITWSRNPTHPHNFLYAIKKVRTTVIDGDYDIVHVHTPVAAFLTRFALRNLRKKVKTRVIYTTHGFHFHSGGGFLKNHIFLVLERIAGNWTDYLVVINREDEEAVRNFRIVEPGRLCYMPGIGVDTTRYSPDIVTASDIDRIRCELHLDQKDKLLLMIAEFNPGKKHKDALRAVHQLHRAELHVAFAGIGPLMPAVKECTRKLGLGHCVHFLGFRNDISRLIRTSMAVLLPSEREGLPRSVMESLCLSVPVIGSDIRGVRDLLDGGCGIRVPLGDVDALARAIEYLLHHPNEALEMGALGRKRMKTYDIKNILFMHEDLYTEALQELHS